MNTYKHYLLNLGLFFCLALISCQSTKSSAYKDPFSAPLPNTKLCAAYQKGIDLYEDEDMRGAIAAWKEVVYMGNDNSICYGRSFYNIAATYAQLEQWDNATNWYQRILATPLDNKDIGSDIMSPYANYHHEAAIKLSQLAYREEDLPKALLYLDSALTAYPYETFSGTSFEKRRVLLAGMRYFCHLEAGDTTLGMHVLTEKILDRDWSYYLTDAASFTNLDFSRDLRKMLLNQLEEQGTDRSAWAEALRQAIQTLTLESTRIGIGKDEEDAQMASFIWEGYTYRLGFSDADKTKKEIIESLLDNRLFQDLEAPKEEEEDEEKD